MKISKSIHNCLNQIRSMKNIFNPYKSIRNVQVLSLFITNKVKQTFHSRNLAATLVNSNSKLPLVGNLLKTVSKLLIRREKTMQIIIFIAVILLKAIIPIHILVNHINKNSCNNKRDLHLPRLNNLLFQVIE